MYGSLWHFRCLSRTGGDPIALHGGNQLPAAYMTTQAQTLGLNYAVLKFQHVSKDRGLTLNP